MSGLSPTGFAIKRLDEIRRDYETAVREEYGEGTLVGPDSFFGRLIGINAERVAELWELAQAVYSSQYPASADGTSLDNVLDLNGLRRIAADPSRVWQVLIGVEGTVIDAGSRVSHAQTGARFTTEAEETLDLVSPNLAVFLRLSGEPHGAAESYSVTLDGLAFPYATAGGETDLDIANALAALVDPAFPITDVDQSLRQFTVAGDHINRFGLVGKRLRVTDAGGTPSNNGQYTIVSAEFTGGNTVVTVAQDIPNTTPDGNLRWNVEALPVDAGGAVFLALFSFVFAVPAFPEGTVDASDTAFVTSFTSSIPANFTLDSLWRPTVVLADEDGPIEAEPLTLTVIETPVVGWNGTHNPIRADVGALRESDADARQRRHSTTRVGFGPAIDGVRQQLLETTGVDSVQIFPNETDFIDADGRPPHSFEAVVIGGRDEDIATTILRAKAAGITTFGNTVEEVVDASGTTRFIRFSRPTDVPVWVDVTVDETYDEEPLPALPADAITQAVVDFGRTFVGGLDVIPQRVEAAILAQVSGLQKITVKVGLSPSTSTTPVPIAADEAARFDASRVSVAGV